VINAKNKVRFRQRFEADAVCVNQVCSVDARTLTDFPQLPQGRAFRWRIVAILPKRTVPTAWQGFMIDSNYCAMAAVNPRMPQCTNTPTPRPLRTNTPSPRPPATATPRPPATATPRPPATATPRPPASATRTPTRKPTNTRTPTKTLTPRWTQECVLPCTEGVCQYSIVICTATPMPTYPTRTPSHTPTFAPSSTPNHTPFPDCVTPTPCVGGGCPMVAAPVCTWTPEPTYPTRTPSHTPTGTLSPTPADCITPTPCTGSGCPDSQSQFPQCGYTLTPFPTSIFPPHTATPSATPTLPPFNMRIVDFDPGRYGLTTDCNSFSAEEPRPGEPNTGNRVKCWIHQSILEWMSTYGINEFNYTDIIQLIVGSEYWSYISYFSSSHVSWADEATARRFYDQRYGCGLDGCQIFADELYMFLSTYQAPRNYVLDNTQNMINRVRNEALNGSSYYQTQITQLDNAVNQILNPPFGEGWANGVVDNQPYGWGTRVDVNDIEAEPLRQKLSYCNPEGFAYRVDGNKPGTKNVFFGVTTSTQGEPIETPLGPVTCSFIG